MASIFIQDGRTLQFTTLAAHTVDDFVLVEETLGVAQDTALITTEAVLLTEGVYNAPCKSADTWNVGQALYWDDAAKEFTITALGNLHRGYAWTGKIATVTKSPVKLANGKDIAG